LRFQDQNNAIVFYPGNCEVLLNVVCFLFLLFIEVPLKDGRMAAFNHVDIAL